jgi:hypothetical protein
MEVVLIFALESRHAKQQRSNVPGEWDRSKVAWKERPHQVIRCNLNPWGIKVVVMKIKCSDQMPIP